MIRDEETIEEINRLWAPVYPFMANHVISIAGIRSGELLDLGPFAGGLALGLLSKCSRLHARVVDESQRMLNWFLEWARETNCSSRVTTRLSSFETIPEDNASFDIVTVRGAFFFITPLLLKEVKRVLRPGGFGWVGGGYGPLTPVSIIAPMAERSRILNENIGKRRIDVSEANGLIEAADLIPFARVSTEGGLWIEVRG